MHRDPAVKELPFHWGETDGKGPLPIKVGISPQAGLRASPLAPSRGLKAKSCGVISETEAQSLLS